MVSSSWNEGDADDGFRSSRYHHKIALPVQLCADLAQEALDAESRRDEQEREERACRLVTAPKLEDLEYLPIAEVQLRGEGRDVRLLQDDDLQKAFQRARHYAGSDRVRHLSVLKSLKRIAERGMYRRVHQPQAAQIFVDLRLAHPNFVKVIELIEDELCLAQRTGEPMCLPPILLNGPPGCGKTFFAQKLGQAIGTGFLRISLESAQTAAELTGTAEHWSNTKPGRIFDALVEGDSANPVVLLDEVDKAGGRDEYRADRALYGLLDRESAKVWTDQAFPTLPLDASYVIWILTSNDAWRIPLPLLSRMHRFDIQALAGHQARLMVRQIFGAIVDGFEGLQAFERELDIGLCDMMRFHSPREVARLSRSLIAHALRHQRCAVTADDLKAVGASTVLLEVFGRFFDVVRNPTKH